MRRLVQGGGTGPISVMAVMFAEMKSIGLIGLLTIALALPISAEEQTAEPSGVWVGEYRGWGSRRQELSRLDGSGSSPTVDGDAVRRMGRGLVILRLDANGDPIRGSMVIAGADFGKEARASKALGSLGITPAERLPLVSYWLAGPLAGATDDERIELAALLSNARSSRGRDYRLEGKIGRDRMRVKVTSVGNRESTFVRLRRCVVPAEQTEAEACSDEALWRQFVESID